VRPPELRSRVFRGWYVVAALFVGGFALYGGGLYSFILFVTPLSDEFHWSYAATGGLVTAFWLSAPLSLMTDRLIRQVGIKPLVTIGILIEVAALVFLFTASHLWQMYLLRALAGLGKVLYAITLPIILSKWFSRRFGMAVAIMYSGWNLGGLAFAPVTQYLIHAFGWRTASVVLGVAVLAIALPPTLSMLRVESAAEIGLGLDGDPLPNAVSSTRTPRRDHVAKVQSASRASFGEVLGNRKFQLMAVATGFYFLTYGGALALQAATVQKAGSARMASLVLGGTTAAAAVGELVGGYMMDRFYFTLATTIQYLLMGSGVLALLLFIHLSSGWLLAVHTVIFGLAIGGTDVFWVTTLKREMPPELFQRAWGIWYFLELAFIVVAPIGAGRLYDLTGNFTAALTAELAVLAVSLPVCLLIARHRRRDNDCASTRPNLL
jgi:MFS family permease